nr:M23 family metallopeptidase [uncultured Actinotalea sp.]
MPTSPPVLVLSALAAGALALGALAPVVAGDRGAPAASRPLGLAVSGATVTLPVDDTRLLRAFAAPSVRWGPGHRGVDLAADVGAPVRAPADGVVVVARRVVERDVLTVLHADGLRSSLEPVDADVAVGTPVRAGQVVGRLATGGHCAGCLHWGVRDGERYVDPLGLLDGDVVVRLLPSARRRGRVSRVRSPAATSSGAASPRCASARSGTR